MYLYEKFYIQYDKFSVAPNPVDASSIKVSTTNDDIKLSWKVITYVNNYQI